MRAQLATAVLTGRAQPALALGDTPTVARTRVNL
jgi:hypothetical protein